MSQLLAKLRAADQRNKMSRAQILALGPDREYKDGRTKQCHADECNIDLIMKRFNRTGTVSHLMKYEGVYADFSDFDFRSHITKLARGQEIFDDLTAELRKEFGQSPEVFFQYVNDPANKNELRKRLTGLAEPGRQLPSADQETAVAAASEPQASEKPKEGDPPTPEPDKAPPASS